MLWDGYLYDGMNKAAEVLAYGRTVEEEEETDKLQYKHDPKSLISIMSTSFQKSEWRSQLNF
jgi:hypothetical protein